MSVCVCVFVCVCVSGYVCVGVCAELRPCTLPEAIIIILQASAAFGRTCFASWQASVRYVRKLID